MGPHLFNFMYQKYCLLQKTIIKLAPIKRAHPTAKPLSAQVSGFEAAQKRAKSLEKSGPAIGGPCGQGRAL
jgi:hypothetical protein